MNSEDQSFGALLKSAIRKRGISTSAFSRTLETSTAYLQNIESGRRSAGPEIMANILSKLDLSESEMNDLLLAAAEQSDSLEAGIEVGNWKFATHWWKLYGLKAIKDMGFDPDDPNIQFRWWPVVHEKWLIRCHFRNPDVMVVLGYDEKKDRIEAAHRDFDLRMTTPLPTRATCWWPKSLNLGPMSSDGTAIQALETNDPVKICNPINTQH